VALPLLPRCCRPGVGPARRRPRSRILKDRVGNVLVSRGDALVSAAKEQRLTVGTRVLTTAQAKVTISYDTGAMSGLNENERFTVDGRPLCGTDGKWNRWDLLRCHRGGRGTLWSVRRRPGRQLAERAYAAGIIRVATTNLRAPARIPSVPN
jgi:hypothetical protein